MSFLSSRDSCIIASRVHTAYTIMFGDFSYRFEGKNVYLFRSDLRYLRGKITLSLRIHVRRLSTKVHRFVSITHVDDIRNLT